MYENATSPSSMTTLDQTLQAAETDLQEEDLRALPAEGGDNVSNIEKVRDILFGGYARDSDKRLKRLEERLVQENQHLRDDMLQRVKALEDMLTRETDSLAEKARADRQERQLAHQDLVQELSVLKNELNNRFTLIDEQIGKEIKQLRQQIHNKAQELTLQIRQQNDNLMSLIKQETAQLQEEKVNRTDLAAFFTEFAFRLNRDFNRQTENK